MVLQDGWDKEVLWSVLASYDGEMDEQTSFPQGQGKGRTNQGFIYEGEWHQGLPHGKGKGEFPTGVVYEGDWREGTPCGHGRVEWQQANGENAVYEGGMKHGKRHGHGRLSCRGATYDGEWKSSHRTGRGTMAYPDETLYQGDFSQGFRSGRGYASYRDGEAVYEGEWRNDQRHGHGTARWRNGEEYVGEWRNGRMHGRGSFAWAPPEPSHQFPQQRDRHDGYFSRNERNLTGAHDLADGARIECTWKDGRKEGRARLTFESGEETEVLFEEDKLRDALPTFPGSLGPVITFPREPSTSEAKWTRKLIVRYLTELRQVHRAFSESPDGFPPSRLEALLRFLGLPSPHAPMNLLLRISEQHLPPEGDPRHGKTLLMREMCSALVAVADVRFIDCVWMHERVHALLARHVEPLAKSSSDIPSLNRPEEPLVSLGVADSRTIADIARLANGLLGMKEAVSIAGKPYCEQEEWRWQMLDTRAGIACLRRIELTRQEAVDAVERLACACFASSQSVQEAVDSLATFKVHGTVDKGANEEESCVEHGREEGPEHQHDDPA